MNIIIQIAERQIGIDRGVTMYPVSEMFHAKYSDMYDKIVKVIFKDGSERVGLFNDEFFEDSAILVNCEVIKIADIERMELVEY